MMIEVGGAVRRASVPLVLASALLTGAANARATDLDLYAQILERHTREVADTAGTRVDYAGLLDSSDWKKLVASLEASAPNVLGTRAEKLAFWINAYNILAIETVLSEYPVASIKDIGPFWSTVWKRTAGCIGGEDVSLHEIEHEILRRMAEPGIHAAIVCASVSCPPLLREPWRADVLEAQFDAAMRRWLSDPHKGMRLSRATRELHLSSVFKWFAGDFASEGGVIVFVTRYASQDDARWLSAHAADVSIEYLDYDWGLNDLERRGEPPVAAEGNWR